LLGLAVGAVYAVAAQGLVVVYRGSGVLNFAHGAMALLGAAFYMELREHEAPTLVAVVLPVLAMAVVGVLISLGIMRQLRQASALARLVATLGILAVVSSAAQIRYGPEFRFVASFLPEQNRALFGDVSVGEDRLWIIGIAVLLTAALSLGYRRTEFGRSTSAVAENQRSASALGISPDVVATANWALGGALAALAGILIVPITGFAPGTLALLIVPVLASAMVGGFSSFWLTALGGAGIGILQSEMTRYVTVTGWAESAPFLAIIPLVGPVRRRRWTALSGLVVAGLVIATGSPDTLAAFVLTFSFALIALSVVVVTGYAGQVSLAQYGLAGVGAFLSARIAGDLLGLPFLLALPIGVLAAVPFGLVFALPALRTRGVNLAIATLGLAVALQALLFNNKDWTGGFEGTTIAAPTLFGWSIDSVTHPGRYSAVALVVFTAFAFAVSNLRRGRAGRRLLATRANERAAASLGISTMGAKLYAFSLGAGIAAAGGVLLAYRYPNVDFIAYDVFNSINAVVLTFLGGIGFIGGALFGGLLVVGGLVPHLMDSLFDFGKWATLVTGVALILMVINDPNGAVFRQSLLKAQALRLLRRGAPEASDDPRDAESDSPVERVAPRTLEVSGLQMRFGGVVALSDVSLQVRPGEIVGLIGPNGAGKTTLIDVVTGFTKPTAGRISIEGEDITALSARRRAGAGIGRSFQNLELFEDLTVQDNLCVAAEERDLRSYVTDLFRPSRPRLTGAARRAVADFQLGSDLHRTPTELSYGKRRLLAIARSVARQPSVLLLDEPAAGLDETESRELGQLLRKLADDWGTAVLLVEHDMGLVMEICDRVVVLEFGCKIADGTPEEVRGDASVIAAYLGQQRAEDVADAPSGALAPTTPTTSGVSA
jgi:ABC-type branched-subunit amino acid transport system ATPase component/branched-subunit amino acid ABC-type transport system permease component